MKCKKPTINDRLVRTFKSVLQILLKGENHSNEIIKASSKKDRSYILCIIHRVFEDDDLVVRIRQPKDSRKEILKLTEAGKDIALLLQTAEKYDESYEALSVKIGQSHFPTLDLEENSLKGRLLARHWKTDEIKHYDEWQDYADYYLMLSPFHFLNAVIVRYFVLLKKYQFGKQTNTILAKIISDIMASHLISGFKVYPSSSRPEEALPQNWSPLLGTFRDNFMKFQRAIDFQKPLNFYIHDHIIEVRNAILQIINPASSDDALDSLLMGE